MFFVSRETNLSVRIRQELGAFESGGTGSVGQDVRSSRV